MGRKAATSLGKSLVRRNKPGWDKISTTDRHTQDVAPVLKSLTEESSYEEFIATAALAGKDFTAEKLNIKFVSLSSPDDREEEIFTEEEKKLVVVPRRPRWTTEMTAEELDTAEKEAFLMWRRSMANLQEKEGITPFERNIEVWRQLWRVVEKSNIVVQIVDARNPLLYRCDDLECYVKEMGKTNVLLINKADFLTESQRAVWSNYFTSINLQHAFYSAAMETLKIGKKETIEEEDEDFESDSDSDSEEECQETNEVEKMEEPEKTLHSSLNSSRILDREELIDYLRTFKSLSNGILNVGLVGYPNVGKSSTINSLMASKHTSVSSTPGKTKHFQTLFLEEDILLCDCPGLVMPAFGGSKGEMVLGGILPIDQLTSYDQAMDLLSQRIPKSTLEKRYGITLPKEYNYTDVLNSYAFIRGFMTARGLPDGSRAARKMLKDYVDGKTIYSYAPPNYEESNYRINEEIERNEIFESKSDETGEKKTTLKKTNREKDLDTQFFNPYAASAHIKGRQMIASGSSSSATSAEGKEWKKQNKHSNKNKKEKLRRVYRHLDV